MVGGIGVISGGGEGWGWGNGRHGILNWNKMDMVLDWIPGQGSVKVWTSQLLL